MNIAAGQLRDPGLVADVVDILDATGLPPDRLQLELLETAVIRPEDAALTALRALADAGLRIAVDDFGTGQANHAYLRRLPLHELKLAAEFVTGVGGPDGDTLDQHLAASLIDLGAHARADRHRRGRGDRGPGRLAARGRLRHGAGLALLPRPARRGGTPAAGAMTAPPLDPCRLDPAASLTGPGWTGRTRAACSPRPRLHRLAVTAGLRPDGPLRSYLDRCLADGVPAAVEVATEFGTRLGRLLRRCGPATGR